MALPAAWSRKTLIHLACAAALSGLAPVGSHAQTTADTVATHLNRDYSIPAGSLEQVLARFAAESGVLLASPLD
ncbi:hypothetical protein D557_3210 [Bordetella holmesii 70147]|nr:hypothetical protein D555_3971 [Bordetella holmesii 35009]EWM45221.1 hypothetical protein D557_3210 [Bordetella holmesii 70147]